MTIVPFLSLGTCIAQIQSVCVNFACPKRLFSLSAEAITNVRNARLCVEFLLNIKQIPFSGRLVQGFTFLNECQNNLGCYWRCVLSWQVLSQQREMRIYWWLCNNSEVQLCLWKVWSLVVCSQSPFCVTRARKDNEDRQITFFLC